MLNGIRKLFGFGRDFHEEAEILRRLNVNSDHFEKNKANGALNLNDNMSTLNGNNESISAIRIAYEKGVIGSKINIQMRTEDEEFNSSFEKLLKQWSKKGNCETTGRFYRGLIERSLIGYAKIQGGYLIRHHTNKSWEIPYKIEIIPIHMIDRTQTEIENNLFNGIKVNNYGEIVGYHIYQDVNKTTSKYVSAKDISLFLIPFLDATQYSGVSPFAPVLATLDMLSTYSLAELQSAKQRAEGAIIIKTHLFDQILNIKKQKAKESRGIVPEQEIAELYKSFKINGSLTGANYIPDSDEVVDLKAKADTIFESLETLGKRGVSAGAGLSTQTTFREMPSSYNASLLNAQLDDEQFAIDFEDFIELTWREVIEVRLLQALILSGKIKAPDYWKNHSKYECVEFIRKSRSHIDPAKHQKAITEGLENGSLNMPDELAKSGIDTREHIAKKIKYAQLEEEMYKQAGLTVPAKENSSQTVVEKKKEEEDEEDEIKKDKE